MIKTLLLSVFLFNTVNIFSADLSKPLPNWLDPQREKKVTDEINLPATRAIPPADFRIPAEYEPTSAVLISYAGYTSMLNGIAQAVTNKANATVWVMSGPASMSGVPKDKYVNFSIPIDTVWMRDYGPFGLSEKQSKVAIVDTVYRHYQYRKNDDAVPQKVGQANKIDVYGANLILDGGNFMVDTYGNLFMTERTYMWNSDKSKDQVNSLLKNYFKVKNIYTFEYAGYPDEPADGTGHIDMFIKLLNDHTVLIARSDTEPFKTAGDKAAAFFNNKTAPDGNKYTVLRVAGYYAGGTWYTYTNSLIVNGYVLMPSYSSYSTSNTEAQKAYESAGLKVVQINSDDSIGAGGSIHCVTQVIPDAGKILKENKSEDVISKSVENIPIEPIESIVNSTVSF